MSNCNTPSCNCNSTNNVCGCKTSSDFVAYTGPTLPCTGIENCTRLTEAIATISEYLCSAELVQTIINIIINNETLYSQFTTIVNNTVDCETVWNCATTTTTTTTVPITTTTTTIIPTTTTTSTTIIPTTTTTTTVIECFSIDVDITAEFIIDANNNEVFVVYPSCPDGKSEEMMFTEAGKHFDVFCSINLEEIEGYYYVGEEEISFDPLATISENPCLTTTTTTII